VSLAQRTKILSLLARIKPDSLKVAGHVGWPAVQHPVNINEYMVKIIFFINALLHI